MKNSGVKFDYRNGEGIVMLIDGKESAIFDRKQTEAISDALDRYLLPDEEDWSAYQENAWNSLDDALADMRKEY